MVRIKNIYGKIDKSAKSNLLLFDNLRIKPQMTKVRMPKG